MRSRKRRFIPSAKWNSESLCLHMNSVRAISYPRVFFKKKIPNYMPQTNSKANKLSAITGILWLLPIVCMFGILIYQPHRDTKTSITTDSTKTTEITSTKNKPQYKSNKEEKVDIKLSQFDPNTVDYKQLRALGLTKAQSTSVIKYRKTGKVFRIKEDLATCYGLTDSIYFILEPYIKIGNKYKIQKYVNESYENKKTHSTPYSTTKIVEKRDSLFIFDPNTVTKSEFMLLGFSARQTETFLKYREMVGHFDRVEKFLKCYSVADRAEELKPYIAIQPIPKLELNGADSTELCRINGIGAISAKAIIDYRKKLGGFVKIEQLCEIKQITERNYEKIYEKIYVDSVVITKIDVNFAPAERLTMSLLAHPYAGRLVVRRLIKNRQLKGGWRNIGELVEQDIVTSSQAEKLAPYLHFRVPTKIN